MTSILSNAKVAFALLRRHLNIAGASPSRWMWVFWRGARIVGGGGLASTLARHSADLALYANYAEWHARHLALDAADEARIAARIAEAGELPLLSVIMPTFNTPPAWLEAAVRSVAEQLYPRWELCIVDDGSTSAATRQCLRDLARDPRIRMRFLQSNTGIGRASNSAIEMTSGDWVVLLDHDDVLAREALYLIWEAARAWPSAHMIYSDEDKLGEGGTLCDPHFKPSWDPELALTTNYLGHAVAIRRALLQDVGGFAADLDGAQDWDLLLRCAERVAPQNVRHIPRVLYHWRVHRNSTSAGLAAKPRAEAAQREVMARAMKRRGITGEVLATEHGWRIRRSPIHHRSVSVVVPTRGRADLLEALIPRLADERRDFDIDLVVIDQDVEHMDVAALIAKHRSRIPISLLTLDGPFNFAQLCNLGVGSTRGEFIVLLNDDVLPRSQEWLGELITHAARPEVGVVGSLLHYPDGRLQHAGILLGINGIAEHIWRGYPGTWGGTNGRARHVQEMSAVTGACLVMRREVWKQIGGMDERFARDFNDIDLCRRVQARGLKVLITPFANAIHYESATRGFNDTPEMRQRYEEEERRYHERWGDQVMVDPRYNPSLTLTGMPFSLAPEPAAAAPWRERATDPAR